MQGAVTEKFNNVPETDFSRAVETLGDRARSRTERKMVITLNAKFAFLKFFCNLSVTVFSKLVERIVYIEHGIFIGARANRNGSTRTLRGRKFAFFYSRLARCLPRCDVGIRDDASTQVSSKLWHVRTYI